MPGELLGFPPAASPAASILILGSMPGQASLDAHRYYAHPRNAFWPIMSALLNFPVDLAYAQRLLALENAGIALWDVIASCHRSGSLDANIAPNSIKPNDFADFLAVHRNIQHIFFNGAAAETAFRRHVLASLPNHLLNRLLQLHRLPSTSPAHAACRYAEKLAAWSAIVALPKT